jgi:hypothetical protein
LSLKKLRKSKHGLIKRGIIHGVNAVREGRKGSGVNLREQVVGQISVVNQQSITALNAKLHVFVSINMMIVHDFR